jgi:2-polyprenyl-3-methyl-5-hydroxy-6-metoxy-1,4-benzoquinol methylase
MIPVCGPFIPIASFPAAPFTIGAVDGPHNAPPFPDTAPLDLEVDTASGLVRQVFNIQVDNLMSEAYRRGSLLGTAMDDTDSGRAYAADFIDFVQEASPLAGRKVLEIGAGRGYFLTLLQKRGAAALGVEPGAANAPYWRDKKVDVVQDFFPTAQAPGPFDLIAGYAVLEHVAEPMSFLAAVRSGLAPGGLAVFAVPDCGPYIVDGDPGMLLHEHWNYFSATTLARMFEGCGFQVTAARKAGVGGVLYIAAKAGPGTGAMTKASADVAAALAFADKAVKLRRFASARAASAMREGSLGLYVPGRALMWLEPLPGLRFFDDDPDLAGRYYPPFDAPIEGRPQLLANPVDELWVLSRSFGARIAAALHDAGQHQTRVLGISELLTMAAASVGST